jgi:chemotaxis protein methyltransferase CheR
LQTFYPNDLNSEIIQISDELFLRLGKMITDRYGIKMPPDKKIMFQARLQRRLRELGIHSFDEYAEKILVENADSQEFTILADYISTNKTDFYREKDHFSFVTDFILPEYINKSANHRYSTLKIWSAGCSSGQEAYSIAISVEEFMRLKQNRFGYSIFATDISYRMLKAAKEAIYPMNQIDEIPTEIKHRYFLKSKNKEESKVRVVKNVRDQVQFAYLNLMDSQYAIDIKFDLVFLRNTLIYFDIEIQRKVLVKILDKLNPGSYLFIGHSESLINMNLPIKSIAPSVYIKTNT